ncbi:hydantoinase/oxoprolinase family protein [Aquabacterium sp. OR-4]|uniref:hydantoinase/oxoprolinase family protein n=1 Tax=Aquabacterium sp. OR-4 TaxID=2978127 RepID=UPI0021B19546|nr:hydantoinase/oxoprolinase family protein [Aquabacterium sp. OR-4]MDT7838290.1 hydantoinase/oxoprolinase family protein [Aquabacterium sp. OR-4]
MSERALIGWDIGGAHVKACLMRGGRVHDLAQWPCTLWLGLSHLQAVLQAAWQRWPALDGANHAVTMSGEMADLFADREDGVRRISAQLATDLRPRDAAALQVFAGEAGWCTPGHAAALWPHIASANWLATARHAAAGLGEGVLVDIGSTTTDLIALAGGQVLGASRSDAQRLASGELVYHGVVRTPLCALGPRIAWRGQLHNVMNEWFATSADVYRLTGELDPAHDQQAAADQGLKNQAGSQARLARMIGLDAREGSAAEWLGFAQAWRARQVAELAGQLQRVLARLPATAPGWPGQVVSAGCGDFLLPDVLAQAWAALPGAATAPRPRLQRYVDALVPIAADSPEQAARLARWAQVCAPSVAVAALWQQERG